MIIKSSTTLRNDYFEKREELIRLKAKLDAAEQSRILGEPTISIEEARQRLKEKFANG